MKVPVERDLFYCNSLGLSYKSAGNSPGISYMMVMLLPGFPYASLLSEKISSVFLKMESQKVLN